MEVIRAYTPNDYNEPARSKMIEAGLISVEYFEHENGKTFWIAVFNDGYSIDSRNIDALSDFYKKCYNE